MKLLFKALAAGVLLAAAASNANAITIQFSCTGDQSNSACTQSGSGGGTTSAILNFTQTAPNTLRVVVDNTSPDFAPGLTSFGFNIDPDGAGLLGFTAVAFDEDGNDVDLVPSQLWDVDFGRITRGGQGLTASVIPNNGPGIRDALYNPDATGGFASSPLFTTATFTFTFDQAVSLAFDDSDTGSGLTGFSFVRFQNVGDGGGGSTKIACSVSDPSCTPTVVPEPGMLGLVGGSLIGIGFLARRRRLAV